MNGAQLTQKSINQYFLRINMQFCTRCLYSSNHPFGIIFDDEGVCTGCRVHEEKDTLDWGKRQQKLKNILDSYRNTSKTNYDCIIPVSGGKDSYFIVDIVKNKYKMNPLLVSYNTHYNTLTGIRNLQNLKTRFGCDLFQLNINPNTAKEIVKFTLRSFGNIYWLNHAGGTVFPIILSVKLKIPLIIWGLHQGLDQVGMYSHVDEVEMTRKFRKEHDLMGFEPEDLCDLFNCPDNIKDEMSKFFYPTNHQIKNIGVKGIYLNNYIRWDSKTQHERMIDKYSFQTIKQNRTFNPYEDTHSLFYNDVHDYLKQAKLGYSKVIDHAVQEIRLKRISRDEGIKLSLDYRHKPMKHLDEFLRFVDIGEDEFWEIIDNFKVIHSQVEDYKIIEHLKKRVELKIIKEKDFIINQNAEDFPKIHSYYKGIYL